VSEPDCLDVVDTLGHDMRRPLSVVRGAATLLLEAIDELPRERRDQMLGLIAQGVEEMTDMIEDLQAAVHVRASDLPVAREPIQLASLVEAVVERTRRGDASRPLAVDPGPPDLVAEGDPPHAARVVRALLANALGQTPPDSPIEVVVRDGGGVTRVEVLARGPGLLEAGRELAFEPLGLYMARGVARAMGGDVGAEPRPGGGTAFWFTLRKSGPAS
jgi:signal transduction histidine kinase